VASARVRAHTCARPYPESMSLPAREPVPELDAEDALHGVVNQLTINGERMTVIIPGSVIEALRVLAEVAGDVQKAGRLAELVLRAMPWAAPLNESELSEFASELVEAAASGDRAPERLATVMRAWRETAEILGNPEAMAKLAESAAALDRGDVVRGRDAVRALRPRR
jgi:hypothetical protein